MFWGDVANDETSLQNAIVAITKTESMQQKPVKAKPAEADDLGIWDIANNMGKCLKLVFNRIQGQLEQIRNQELALFDPIKNPSRKTVVFPKNVVKTHKYELYELQDDLYRKKKLKGTSSPKKKGANKEDLSKREWISILNKNENLLENAEIAEQIAVGGAKHSKAASEQLDWVKRQMSQSHAKFMRLEHLLSIVEKEQMKEIDREMALNAKSGNPEALTKLRARVYKERVEFGDMIMRLLFEYNVVSGMEMIRYLEVANKTATDELKKLKPLKAAKSPTGLRDDELLENDIENVEYAMTRPSSQSDSMYLANSRVTREFVEPHTFNPKSEHRVIERKDVLKMWGGWDSRLPYAAENIISELNNRESIMRPPFKVPLPMVGQRVDKLPKGKRYSHLINRGVDTTK